MWLNIHPRNLKLADVLFSREPTVQSTLIALSSFSRFSHAFIYSGNNKIIQASGGTGVTEDSIEYLKDHGSSCWVYRHRALSHFHALQVVQYCRRAVGRPYNYALAALSPGHNVPMNHAELRRPNATSLASTSMSRNPTMYCSQLVALAYESAGLPIVHPGQANLSNPGTMRFSHVLKFVNDLYWLE